MACIVINNKVKKLAEGVNEDPLMVANKIGIWQEQNHITDLEKFPTKKEYKSIELTKVTDLQTIGTKVPLDKIDLDFNSQERKDRVTLISQLFSDTLDRAVTDKLQDYKDQLTVALSKNDNVTADKLQGAIDNINRLDILKVITPQGIWNKVKQDYFDNYLQGTQADRIAAEKSRIDTENIDDTSYTDEERLHDAKIWADYKELQYKKISDNFKNLANEAARKLVFSEKIKVDVNDYTPTEINDEDIQGEEVSPVMEENNGETLSQEEVIKDNWMFNFREVSSRSSLSGDVRRLISQIIKVDPEGYAETDDLGNTRYLDPDYVHATLIDGLRWMLDSKDLLPLLNKLSKNQPWISQVIKRITSDDKVFTAFYNDFRKQFQSFWIQKSILQKDGSVKTSLQPCNKSEGIYYLLNAWRNTLVNRESLSKNSVYTVDKQGNFNTEAAKIGLNIITELQAKLSQIGNFNTQELNTELAKQDNIDTINNLLKGIGVTINLNSLTSLLQFDFNSSNDVKMVHPIFGLLGNLNTIYSDISKNKVKAYSVREDGSKSPTDLINEYSSVYTSIAKSIDTTTEDAIESSFRENGKTYYSHVVPAYMGKLIANLKDIIGTKLGNSDRFMSYIQNEFGQYSWFYKNNRFMNGWLNDLVNNKKAREILDHKVLLNAGKIDYSDWDNRDTEIALLNEYWSDKNALKGGDTTAWYHVPILSDTASSEFIKFFRYTNQNSEQDEFGNYKGYINTLLPKYRDIVAQEFERINLVLQRDFDYNHNPNTKVSPITNYDISRNSNGTIKSMGGAEFKFIPELNNYRYEDESLFIDKLSELINSKTPNFTASEFLDRVNKGEQVNLGDLNTQTEKIEYLIDRTITDIMERGFNTVYNKWSKDGILELTEDGTKYKYLPFESQYKINASIKKGIQYALENIPMTEEEHTLSEQILKTNGNINATDYEDLFNTLIAGAPDNYITTLSKLLSTKNYAREALEEYYWNSKYATSQIIQLATTDLAFYSSSEDFQKRFKEVHSPANKLDTQAKWNGETVGRTTERTVYLKDDVITSPSISDIAEILDERVKSNLLSKSDRDDIISKFQNVNVADAQAYRSLSSYRAVSVMSHDWSDEKEQAYKNFMSGKWDAKDFGVIWQTKKPFLYTQVSNDNGLNGQPVKTPVQHKNSEFLLMAAQSLVAGPLGNSGKLRAINDFMEKHNIDVVQFESAVKVGKQGLININNKVISGEETVNKHTLHFNSFSDLKDQLDRLLLTKEISNEDYGNIIGKYTIQGYDDTLNTLENVSQVNTVQGGNPNVTHSVNYDDYGIQTLNPEHLIDIQQLIGTQIKKLITSDISEDAQIKVGNKVMSKRDLLSLYNEVNVENVLRSSEALNTELSSKESFEKLLQNTIRGSERYSIELAKGLTLSDDGEFLLPPSDPSTSVMTQTLINSIIKDKITKQKIRGGAVIQVSCYGVEDLHIVFDGEGSEKRIKYLECRMPWYTAQYLKPLMNNKDHTLDINKVPEELRKLIGLRVPTEDKYSMAPLYIKEFLPSQNGSAIQLPSEITTLAGSDFDVDKLYLMLPEFKLNYNVKEAWKNFYSTEQGKSFRDSINKAKDTSYNLFKDQYSEDELSGIEDGDLRKSWEDQLKSQGINDSKFTEGVTKAFGRWFSNNKDNYVSGIQKDSYDYNKPASEQSTAQRNNSLVDMMWGVLTNKDTASKILNPGGFDYIKRAARIVTILENSTKEDLIKDLGKDYSKVLYTLPLDNLNKLASKYKVSIDPLSPDTLVYFHQQNMTGKKLIAIYANQNANHALMQNTDLQINSTGVFTLNGRKYTSLHSMLNADNEYISKNNANYLAAAADTAKDPVLASISQNLFTADASCLLSRLGYNPIEIGTLMRQPIIRDIIDTYDKESRTGKWKDAIIDETVKHYRDIANNTFANKEAFGFENKAFLISDLMNNILNGHNIEDLSDNTKREFYVNQVNVGLLFKQIMRDSDALSTIVQATKSDTQGGGAGPTIADTNSKIKKIDDLNSANDNDNYPISGIDSLVGMDKIDNNMSLDQKRDILLHSKLPYIQAFYSLGLEQTSDIFSKIMPFYNAGFTNAVNTISKLTKSGKLDVKTINNIYNDLFTYIYSRTEFFGDELNKDGSIIKTSQEKRNQFINVFPNEFKKIISENEDISSLGLIKRLRVVSPTKGSTVQTIVFKNVGNISPQLKEEYSRDWTSLLHSSNPVAIQLAIDLFRYNYYRNGFTFGPETFNHLASTALKLSIPDYRETLINVQNDRDSLYSEFSEQYIYNHLNNRKLVPELTNTSKVVLEKGKLPLDTIKVAINKDSNDFAKKVIKTDKTVNINGKKYTEYEFMNFITTRVSGKNTYYRLSDNTTTTATYIKINKLGSPSNFLEYEYGKNVSEINSVVPTELQSPDDFIKTITEEDAPRQSEYKEEKVNRIFEDSLKEVYGDDNLEVPKDWDSTVSPLDNNDNTLKKADQIEITDMPDDNDEQICHGTIIGKL